MVKFSSHTVKFSKSGDENLTVATRKPDQKNNYKVVLNTRDIEDSGTIFGFLVSIHTKKCWTFEIFLSKIGPIWRFGHLEPLWVEPVKEKMTMDC